MKSIFTLLIICIIIGDLQSQPNDCVPNSGENATIFIGAGVTPILNGMPLPLGSYITAVFASPNGKKCAGFTQWQNSPTAISAFGATSGFEGYAIGENYKIRLELPDGKVVPDSFVKIKFKIPDGLNCFEGGTYIHNGFSCIDSITATYSFTAVKDLQLLKEVVLSPNPTNGKVYFDAIGIVPNEVRITNSSGAIYILKTTDKYLDLSGYPLGHYFLRFSNGNDIFISRISLIE